MVIGTDYKHNINTKKLVKILKMKQREVKRYCKGALKHYGYEPVLQDGYLYAKGNLPVVLMAHMDTVFGNPKHLIFKGNTITSTNGLGADDRAGVYGILHLLDQGYRPTVILLEDEEIGCVGAKKFIASDIRVHARFIIELDRQGKNDCVFYDCDNEDFTQYIEDFGFKSAYGTYSDISVIAPALGISAVNLSVGYYGQHTKNEFLDLTELDATLNKVAKIFENLPDATFEYKESQWTYWYSKYSTKSSKKSKSKKYYSDNYYYNNDGWDYYNNFDYDKWCKDVYASETIDELANAEVTSDAIDKYFFDENTKLELVDDCYLKLENGTIIDLHFNHDYMIADDNQVYHYAGALVQGAKLFDYHGEELFYSDFVANPSVSYLDDDYEDFETKWKN